jgi:cobalt-precorrin-5B (C1)-methyltransferase
LRVHPIDRLTIAGGFAKLTKLAQGALDLHSGRSQVSMAFLADEAERLGLDASMRQRILDANTAQEVLELTTKLGLDLAAPIAARARETALATLKGAPVDVEVIVIDRKGTVIARV